MLWARSNGNHIAPICTRGAWVEGRSLQCPHNGAGTHRRACITPCPGLVFELNFALEAAIGSHACSLGTSMHVANSLPLGCPLPLTVTTMNCVETLKVNWSAFEAVDAVIDAPIPSTYLEVSVALPHLLRICADSLSLSFFCFFCFCFCYLNQLLPVTFPFALRRHCDRLLVEAFPSSPVVGSVSLTCTLTSTISPTTIPHTTRLSNSCWRRFPRPK
jgi:hypothetical protein